MTKEELLIIPETVFIDGDAETREVYVNGKFLNPVRSQNVWNHSPDGFNWGYSGSGPAQLALAILLRFMSKENAIILHQRFKTEFISRLPQGEDFEERIHLREIIQKLSEEAK